MDFAYSGIFCIACTQLSETLFCGFHCHCHVHVVIKALPYIVLASQWLAEGSWSAYHSKSIEYTILKNQQNQYTICHSFGIGQPSVYTTVTYVTSGGGTEI